MLVDKNGTPIEIGTSEIDDDVLSKDGKHYRIYYHQHEANNPTGIEMLGCDGYIHAVSESDTKEFERIGKYKDNEHLFECD